MVLAGQFVGPRGSAGRELVRLVWRKPLGPVADGVGEIDRQLVENDLLERKRHEPAQVQKIERGE